MDRGPFYLFLAWHFVCMLAYNVSSTAIGYRQLETGSGSGHALHMERIANAFTSFLPVRAFAQYAGTATGYGFFAPQVGSSFRLEVSVIDPSESLRTTLHAPSFAHTHSLLRYQSLLGRLQHLITDTPHNDRLSLPLRQARALAHCLAQRLALHHWGPEARPIRCEVYVCHHNQRTSIYQKMIDLAPTP